MDKIIECQKETKNIYSFEKSGNFTNIELINSKKYSKLVKVQSINNSNQENPSKFYAIKIFQLIKYNENRIENERLEIPELGEVIQDPMEIDNIEQNQSLYDISDLLSMDIINEIYILQSLEHPNILKLIEFNIQDNSNELWMLFDYYPTNIGEFFKENTRKRKLITETFFKSIALQLIQSVFYLHENLIIHCNLNPENILFDESKNQILISGFCYSKKLSFDSSINNEKIRGVVEYKSPDVLLGNQYYCGSLDVWSIGCILIELIIGRVLFQGNNELEVLKSIYGLFEENEIKESQSINDINEKILSLMMLDRKPNLLINYIKNFSIIDFNNDDFYDLIEKMLNIDPIKRITLEDCLNHSWFKQKKI